MGYFEDPHLIILKRKHCKKMGQSYFDQKFQTLKSKLVSTYVNEEVLKLSYSLPQHLCTQSMPYLTMKLFEIFDSMIDEVSKMKNCMKETNKFEVDTKNKMNPLDIITYADDKPPK